MQSASCCFKSEHIQDISEGGGSRFASNKESSKPGRGEFGEKEPKPHFGNGLQIMNFQSFCTSKRLFCCFFLVSIIFFYLVMERASGSNRSVFFLEINHKDFLILCVLSVLTNFFFFVFLLQTCFLFEPPPVSTRQASSPKNKRKTSRNN